MKKLLLIFLLIPVLLQAQIRTTEEKTFAKVYVKDSSGVTGYEVINKNWFWLRNLKIGITGTTAAAGNHSHTGTYQPLMSGNGYPRFNGTNYTFDNSSYLTAPQLKTINGNSIVGSGDITITGGLTLPSNPTENDVLVAVTPSGDIVYYAVPSVSGGSFSDSLNFGNNLLRWNRSTRTYLPYSDSTGTGIYGGIYLGNQNPTKNIRVNHNYKMYANGFFVEQTSGLLRYFINSTSGYISTGKPGYSTSYESGFSVNDTSNNTFTSVKSDRYYSQAMSGATYQYLDIRPLATSGTTPYKFYTKSKVTGNLFELGNQDRKKISVDTSGFIKNLVPHAHMQFMDSTITVAMTQNVWYQITRQSSHNSWPDSELVGFTSNGDSLICPVSGHYTITCKVNLTGGSSKDYEYRVMKKTSTAGSTPSEVWRYQVTGLGTRVLRDLSTYINMNATDRCWIEMRCITAAPGDVQLHGGEFLINPVHLFLN